MEAGRELDMLVAEKVMGWRDVELRMWKVGGDTYPHPYGIPTGVDPEDGQIRGINDFSTDIADAILVVGHMRAQGWVWQISIGPTVTVSIERAGARHYDIDNKIVGPGSRRIDVHPVAFDKLPLALCVAALAAVGGESSET